MFYWDQPFLVGWVFFCSNGEQLFFIGLVDQTRLRQLKKHLCDYVALLQLTQGLFPGVTAFQKSVLLRNYKL